MIARPNQGMRSGHASALHEAVWKEDLQLAGDLLETAFECDLVVRNERGRIPLHEAILLGRGKAGGDALCEAMTRLFLRRALPNHFLIADNLRHCALHIACDRKNLTVLKMVLEHVPPRAFVVTDSYDRTPAMTAVDTTSSVFSNVEIGLPVVKAMPWEALVAQGPIYGENAVLTSVLRLGDDILPHILELSPEDFDFTFEPLRSKRDAMTILHCYASSPNQSCAGLTALLDRVPRSMLSTTSGGKTPLHFARNPDTVELLLERMTDEECAIQDLNGNTALHSAECGEVAMLLANRSHADSLAVINHNGLTPLLSLLCLEPNEYDEAALWMATHMSDEDLTATSSENVSVLHLACFHKMQPLVELLLDRLPDSAIAAVDRQNQNALHWCLHTAIDGHRTDTEPSAELLELLMNRLPLSYRSAESALGESPASMAEDIDEELEEPTFYPYFISRPKGAMY